MEQAIIAGIAHDRSEAKVTVVGVPDRVGEAARIFDALADVEVNIDMVVQNVSAAATGLTDISFTLPKNDGARAMAALAKVKPLIGAGMKSHPGVTAVFFEALSEANVNAEMISTSEIRISVVCRADVVKPAVQAIHTAFDLDADAEAVVYGGTGR